jgi:nucleotide-binding universal stress UspA family protein
MINEAQREESSRIVLVIGLDLSEVSKHLVSTARNLVRSVDEVELHLVHVVHRDSIAQRLADPLHAGGTIERAETEYAHWELERLRDAILVGSKARVTVHTPLGDAAYELARVATQVGADMILVEAHHPGTRSGFHRSIVARTAMLAPCSVLAVRQRQTEPRPPIAPAQGPAIGRASPG